MALTQLSSTCHTVQVACTYIHIHQPSGVDTDSGKSGFVSTILGILAHNGLELGMTQMARECAICGVKLYKDHMNQVHGDGAGQEEICYKSFGYVCPKTTCSWFGESLKGLRVWA